MARFDNLPRDASPDAIYTEAGQIFEEQAKEDPEKYEDPEAFNAAIWYIAEAAQRQDFIHLRDKSKEEIAKKIGNSVSGWLRIGGSQTGSEGYRRSSMSKPTSIADIDLTPKKEKYWTCGREWREEFIYFLLVDRFHDNEIRRPVPTPEPAPSEEKLSKFCGGTLKGIRENLDYIHELGCTALWISPVFENNEAPCLNSDKYHGYAIQNYLDIDKRFGSKEDLIKLVEEAHERDMRVFLDIVLNHSGDNWYYEGQEWGREPSYHEDEQYPFGEWRLKHRPLPEELRNPDLYHRRGRIQDYNSYPEYQRGDFYDLKDFNNDEDPDGLNLQNILILVHCYWLRETDIDGFRLDTANYMPQMAVARFCSTLHEYAYRLGKKEFFLFGELLTGDDIIDQYMRPITNHQTIYHGLDSVIDYPLFGAGLPDVIKGRGDPEKLILRYDRLREHARNRSKWGEYLVTFLDNHDQHQRFAADAEDDRQVIAGIGYLLCALGIPSLYYGTEQGFTGHGDKYEFVREPLFALNDKVTNYLNRDCQIYREIAKIAKIRADKDALRFGRMYFRKVSDERLRFALPREQPCTLAFSRILMDQQVLVAYNTSTKERRNDYVLVDNQSYSPGKMRFLYPKEEGEISIQMHPDLNNPSLYIQLDLEPMQFVILESVK